MSGGYIIFLMIGALFAVYPFAVSMRLKALGATTCGNKCCCGESLAPVWVKVKGTTSLTRQSMVLKLTLTKDCLMMKLLWGPSRCISLQNFDKIERLLTNGKTIGIRFIPKKDSTSREFTVSGMHDVATFIKSLEEGGIKCTDVVAERKLFGF